MLVDAVVVVRGLGGLGMYSFTPACRDRSRLVVTGRDMPRMDTACLECVGKPPRRLEVQGIMREADRRGGASALVETWFTRRFHVG